MAFDTGTIQTLGVLRDTLKANQQSKEAEKDRALQMLNLRLRAADSEANRLQRSQEFYGDQVFQLSKSLTELTGKAPKFENIKNATGEGAALVQEATGSIAADLQSARNALNETLSRKDQLIEELGSYFDAANVIAPEVFDSYRKSGGSKGILGESFVEGDEFQSIVSQFEEQGKSLSDTQKAGLQRALNMLGQQRFDNSMKEQNALIARLNATGRIVQAKQAGYDDALKIYRDQYKQWRDTMIGRAQTLEFGPDFSAKIPDILSSATNVEEALYGVADEMVRLAKKSTGVFRTGSDLKDILSEYDSAESTDERRSAAVKLLTEFKRDPKLMASDFEFGILFGDEDKSKYFQDLLRGVDILQNFNDLANNLNPDVYKTNIRNILTGAEPVSGDQSSTKPSSSTDTMGLASKFGNALYTVAKKGNEPQPAPQDLLNQINSQGTRSAIKISDDLVSAITSLETVNKNSTSDKQVSKSLSIAIKEAKLGNIMDEQLAKTYGSRLRSGEDPKLVAKDFAKDAISALTMLGALSTVSTIPQNPARNILGGGREYRGLPNAPTGRPMGPESARPMGAPSFPYDMPPIPQTGREMVPYSLEEIIKTIKQRNLLSK